ncbi:MAG: SIR2 family protein [Saprospiraceae bacterium]
MSDIEKISKQAQSFYQDNPLIILGSGASIAFGMSGMPALSQHLTKDISVDDLPTKEQELWSDFCQILDGGLDLESALHQITLSPEITNRVIVSTWGLLAPEDLDVFKQSINDPNLFALGKLFKHMLRSTQAELDLVTTNYDRLAEYACEQENIHHYTGFSHGFSRVQVDKNYLKCSRQVNIWKVHGSLDWFTDPKGVILALSNVDKIPDGLTPLIVTPGVEKYRSTHADPYRSTIHKSDDIIDKSKTYLCIGFGFNDDHIQEKLVNRCAKEEAQIIVVTHKLSDAAKEFLFKGGVSNYLAIESGNSANESIIYSSVLDTEFEVEADHWSLNGFLKLIF